VERLLNARIQEPGGQAFPSDGIRPTEEFSDIHRGLKVKRIRIQSTIQRAFKVDESFDFVRNHHFFIIHRNYSKNTLEI
jgi:hypothetical protein